MDFQNLFPAKLACGRTIAVLSRFPLENEITPHGNFLMLWCKVPTFPSHSWLNCLECDGRQKEREGDRLVKVGMLKVWRSSTGYSNCHVLLTAAT